MQKNNEIKELEERIEELIEVRKYDKPIIHTYDGTSSAHVPNKNSSYQRTWVHLTRLWVNTWEIGSQVRFPPSHTTRTAVFGCGAHVTAPMMKTLSM